jgi:predicted transcriptional regulator
MRLNTRGNDIQTAVRGAMTAPPINVNTREPLRREIELIEFERVLRIPVLDRNGKMIGSISHVDIAKLHSRFETRRH